MKVTSIETFLPPDWSWDDVGSNIDPAWGHQKQHDAWTEACRDWLKLLNSRLSFSYGVYESDNWILFCGKQNKTSEHILSFLEKMRSDSYRMLEGLEFIEYPGKNLILLYSEKPVYTRYLKGFFGIQADVENLDCTYIDLGYEHIAALEMDIHKLKRLVTYYFVNLKLPKSLPVWIVEGVAQCVCAKLGFREPLEVNKYFYDDHLGFWNEVSIRNFWSGDSFFSNPREVDLASELSEFFIMYLSKEWGKFIDFVNAAKSEDSGEKSLRDNFSITLKELADVFLSDA